MLAWLDDHALPVAALPVAALAEPDRARTALDRIAARLDGRPAAPNTVARKRAVFFGCLDYAVERGDLATSPLARRPYDLRHACLSGWLNAGVAPQQVAEWAGHSVHVLLHVYAKCVDGEDKAARRRIEAALRLPGDPEDLP